MKAAGIKNLDETGPGFDPLTTMYSNSLDDILFFCGYYLNLPFIENYFSLNHKLGIKPNRSLDHTCKYPAWQPKCKCVGFLLFKRKHHP